ncbi:hypothetical protein RISK_001296 [Rhodopirellula islandica]|uniref:Uncharacterized protein n=1 Tax=Rhodopirellula islandica TaxID=595434 RepID=A0A0J1BJN6_RHOIS|nr:hypothetical protein RISK_001296 [Rhodopirellula islandica]
MVAENLFLTLPSLGACRFEVLYCQVFVCALPREREVKRHAR